MNDDDDEVEHQAADFVRMGFVLFSGDKRYSSIGNPGNGYHQRLFRGLA